MGRIFDDRGNLMSPTYAIKKSIKYRYYLSSALGDGRSQEAGTVSRVPATEVETLVANSVREELKLPQTMENKLVIGMHLERVEVHSLHLSIKFYRDTVSASEGGKGAEEIRLLGKNSRSSDAAKYSFPYLRQIRALYALRQEQH